MEMLKGVRKWLTWTFVFEHLLKGFLQAVGAIAVYVALVVLIINSTTGGNTLRDVLVLRSPGLNQLSSSSSTPAAPAAAAGSGTGTQWML